MTEDPAWLERLTQSTAIPETAVRVRCEVWAAPVRLPNPRPCRPRMLGRLCGRLQRLMPYKSGSASSLRYMFALHVCATCLRYMIIIVIECQTVSPR
jgi:hypothetical protein